MQKTDNVAPEKVHKYIKIAGWLGVIPSAVQLSIYQNTGLLLYLFITIVTIILSIYMILTANDESWESRKKVYRYVFLAIFFMGIIPAVPIFMAVKFAAVESK